jgi:hypothetical protein
MTLEALMRFRKLLPIAALGLAALLGGCYAYPAYPGYGYYNNGYYGGGPSYGGGVVAYGGGWGWHRGWHGHDHDWH